MIMKPPNDVYEIQEPRGRFQVVHVNHVAPWNGDHNFEHELDEDAQS